MILIIEGPDLSGKTTAIEKIGKFYNKGFTLKNNFKPKTKENSEQIYKQYWHIINLIVGEDFVILDRFFPSQAVYSYMRGEDELFHYDISILDSYCSKENFVYIFLDTPVAELKRRYIKRGDEHITLGDLRTIRQRYEDFFGFSKMVKYKLDTTESDWLDKLNQFLMEVENGNI